jgi:hypothetical protein
VAVETAAKAVRCHNFLKERDRFVLTPQMKDRRVQEGQCMTSDETARHLALKRIAELLRALEHESRVLDFPVIAYLISLGALEAEQILGEPSRFGGR